MGKNQLLDHAIRRDAFTDCDLQLVFSSLGVVFGAVHQICYFWDPLGKVFYHLSGQNIRFDMSLGAIPLLITEWKRISFNKEITLSDLNKGALTISLSNISVFAGKYWIDASFKAVNGAVAKARFRGWSSPSLNISYRVRFTTKMTRPWFSFQDDTGFRKHRDARKA